MEDWQPKLLQLGYGILAFVAVVVVLMFVVDKAPRRGKERYQLAFFLGPAVLLLVAGLIWPSIRTIWLSLLDARSDEVVGLENYQWMFTQPEILTVLRNTFIWVLITPVSATAIGLLYALLIDKTRGESVQKIFVFMPMAISFVGASIIWKFVYAYRPEGSDQIGLLNQVWVSLGGQPQQWLLNAPANTVFLIIVMVWIQAGFAMVVLSAAIKGIPTEIVEAARIDGVNPWQMFWRITLPSIRPAVIVVYVTISIGVLKVFDIVRTMTGGNYDTSVVANELYTQAFRAGQPGRGSALAVVLFVLVIPIVVFQVRQLRKQREVR
ncbi:MAG: sugar ABC transporter permease [Actinomycetales bacterium]|nr:sugar ABC transporter permease [Actinomycetales bacterium]